MIVGENVPVRTDQDAGAHVLARPGEVGPAKDALQRRADLLDLDDLGVDAHYRGGRPVDGIGIGVGRRDACSPGCDGLSGQAVAQAGPQEQEHEGQRQPGDHVAGQKAEEFDELAQCSGVGMVSGHGVHVTWKSPLF